MKTRNKLYLEFLIILFIVILLYQFSFDESLFEFVKENLGELETLTHTHFLLSIVLFFILLSFVVISPIPMGTIFKILAGYLFGAYLGALVSVLATAFGTTIAFLGVRFFFRDRFEKKYANEIKKINKEVKEHGFYYFLSLRLTNIFPYPILYIFGGLSKLSTLNYFLTTLIGVIPLSLFYSILGQKLSEVNSFNEFLNIETFFFFLIMALVGFGPIIAKKFLANSQIKKNSLSLKK